MWLHPRVEITGPQWSAFRETYDGFKPIRPWTVWGWHGSDEYGNCSVYVTTALLGGITIFPGLHFQRHVEAPQPGDADTAYKRWYQATFRGPERCDASEEE